MAGVNYLALIVGPPEHGKTSKAVDIAVERLRAGYNLFAVDPNRQFKRLVRYYESPAAWLEAARQAARRGIALPRGAGFASADGVTQLLTALGKKFNTVDRARFPMHYIVDEGTAKRDSGSTFISKDDDYLISNRRHLGVSLQLNIQRPSMLVTAWWEVATDIFLFRVSRRRLKKLEDDLELEPGYLTRYQRQLEEHKFIHLKPGKGIVWTESKSDASNPVRPSVAPSPPSSPSLPTAPRPKTGSTETPSSGASASGSTTRKSWW